MRLDTINTNRILLSGVMYLLFIFCISAFSAAWRSSGGPEGGKISTIFAIDSFLIAGAQPGGIYRSIDKGDSWQFVGSGTRARFITNVDTLGDILIASANAGGLQQYALSFSFDKGATWSENEHGWPFMGIESFTVHGNSMFVKVQHGVLYRSDDTAKTWISLEKNVPSGLFLNVNSFYSYNDTLLAATNGGAMFTVDNGNTWVNITRNLPDTAFTAMQQSGNPIYCITEKNSHIYAGTKSAVYMLVDIQNEWKNILRLENDVVVQSLFVKDSIILIGTQSKGLYRSNNNGQNWQNNNYTTLNPTWYNFNYSAPFIYAGTNGNLYKSTNLGDTWMNCETGLKSADIRDIVIFDNKIYASSWGGGVYYKAASKWESINSGLYHYWAVTSLANDEKLYIGTFGKGVFEHYNKEWQLLSGYNDSLSKYWVVRDVCFANSILFIGASGGLFYSQDFGNTITKIPGSDMIIDVNCLYNDSISDNLVIGSNQGVYKFNTITNTLSNQLLVHSIGAISGNQKSLFAGASRQGVLRSDNNGETWTKTLLQLPTNVRVDALACIGDSIFAGTNGLGVFLSSDNGDTWQELNDGLTCPMVKALHIHDGTLYCGTNGGSVFEMSLIKSNSSLNIVKRYTSPKITIGIINNTVKISIKSNNSRRYNIAIIDIAGRNVYKEIVRNDQILTIPLSKTSKTYIVQVKGYGIDIKKIVLSIK